MVNRPGAVCRGGGGGPTVKAPSQCQLQTQQCALVARMDVQVSEVVKGGPESPTCFHIVNFLSEL